MYRCGDAIPLERYRLSLPRRHPFPATVRHRGMRNGTRPDDHARLFSSRGGNKNLDLIRLLRNIVRHLRSSSPPKPTAPLRMCLQLCRGHWMQWTRSRIPFLWIRLQLLPRCFNFVHLQGKIASLRVAVLESLESSVSLPTDSSCPRGWQSPRGATAAFPRLVQSTCRIRFTTFCYAWPGSASMFPSNSQ